MIEIEFLEIFKELTTIVGPSGFEKSRNKKIEQMLKPFVDDTYIDNLGNLTVHKKGNGKKLLIEAHVDTIGIIVTKIDNRGFVSFSMLGGAVAARLVDLEVKFESGVTGIICGSSTGLGFNTPFGNISCSGLYIDLGMKLEDVKKYVKIGDVATFNAGTIVVKDNILISPYIDNLSSCACLIKAMQSIHENTIDLYVSFVVQEENGCRGASAVANYVNPDYALSIDITGTNDCPASIIASDISLGEGTVIKLKDGRVIYDRDFTRLICNLAQKNDLKHQLIMMASDSNAYRIQRSGNGVIMAGMGICTRYIHTPVEMCSLDDIENTIKLLIALMQTDL